MRRVNSVWRSNNKMFILQKPWYYFDVGAEIYVPGIWTPAEERIKENKCMTWLTDFCFTSTLVHWCALRYKVTAYTNKETEITHFPRQIQRPLIQHALKKSYLFICIYYEVLF